MGVPAEKRARDGEASAQRPGARGRGWLLALIALLFVLSVPWYRSPDAPLRLWLGLPDWVAVALACYLAAAVLNARAWWITEIDDPSPAGEDDDGDGGESLEHAGGRGA